MSYLAEVRRQTAAVRSSHERLYQSNKAAFSEMLATSERNRTGLFDMTFGAEADRAEPYRHFKHWVFSIINLVGKRCAGQEFMLAKKSVQRDSERSGSMAGVKTLRDVSPRLWPYRSMAGVKTLDELREQDLEIVYNHGLLDFLQKPNPIQNRWEFIYFTLTNYMLGGLVYWLWSDDDAGKPELWALPRNWLIPDHSKGMFAEYKVNVPGLLGEAPIPGEQVARIYLPDPCNPLGSFSPVLAQMDAVLLDQYIQESQRRGFENGIFPQVIVKMGRLGGRDNAPRRKLTPAQRAKIGVAIRKMWAGATRFGDPAILDAWIEDIVPVSRAPMEMNWKESSELVKNRLCQAFQVSEISLGGTQNANRAASAVADRHLASNVANPVLEQLSIALTNFVVPNWSSEPLTLWIAKCIPEDEELELKQWEVCAKLGAVDDDELRGHLLGLPPRQSNRPIGLSNPQTAIAALKVFELLGAGAIEEPQAINFFVAVFGYTPDAARQLVTGGTLPAAMFDVAAGMLDLSRKGGKPNLKALADSRERLADAAESEVALLMQRFFPGTNGVHPEGTAHAGP